MLALITQFVVSAAMNDMKPEIGTKMVDSMPIVVERRCSAKTFVQELNRSKGYCREGNGADSR